MTIREGISKVRSLNKLLSQDNTISDRVVEAELRSVTSLLIKRETNLRRLWNSNSVFTTVKCLKMKEVPIAECCDYISPCMISRSICKIPKVGEGIYNSLVMPVTTIDGKIQFKEGTPTRYTNLLDLKIKRKSYMFWIQNDYLYVSEPVEAVNFIAYFPNGGEEILEDPICKCTHVKSETDNCTDNPLDREWKIPAYLEDNAITMVHEKVNAIYARHLNDLQSDITKDDHK